VTRAEPDRPHHPRQIHSRFWIRNMGKGLASYFEYSPVKEYDRTTHRPQLQDVLFQSDPSPSLESVRGVRFAQ